jgi:hypothetical protein
MDDPSSLVRSGGVVYGVWFYNCFAAGGNRSYPDYWAITGDPRYPRCKTSTRGILDLMVIWYPIKTSLTTWDRCSRRIGILIKMLVI